MFLRLNYMEIYLDFNISTTKIAFVFKYWKISFMRLFKVEANLGFNNQEG